jgi:hypothetical protein
MTDRRAGPHRHEDMSLGIWVWGLHSDGASPLGAVNRYAWAAVDTVSAGRYERRDSPPAGSVGGREEFPSLEDAEGAW